MFTYLRVLCFNCIKQIAQFSQARKRFLKSLLPYGHGQLNRPEVKAWFHLTGHFDSSTLGYKLLLPGGTFTNCDSFFGIF